MIYVGDFRCFSFTCNDTNYSDNPNKAGIFEGSFFGRGGQFDPLPPFTFSLEDIFFSKNRKGGQTNFSLIQVHGEENKSEIKPEYNILFSVFYVRST